MEKHYLTPLLVPKSVAVFAGTPELRAKNPEYVEAAQLCAALNAQPYSGIINFLDPETTEGRLADLVDSDADLAIIALPPKAIASAIELAGRMNCKSVLVLCAGLTEKQSYELQQIARTFDMWMLGPNGRGFQRPQLGLNASLVGSLVEKGTLALVSQSGALTSAIIDWARYNRVGFSTVISLGPHSVVGVAQALDFLANDPHTQSIVLYLEGIYDARRFMSALRAASISKPVVVLKAGRSEGGNQAAMTHSSAMVGSDEVFDAALRRGGAIRVRFFSELFSAVQCLAARYQPVGNKLAIITNGGGPGVLAADRAQDLGLVLAKLSDKIAEQLRPKLLPQASLSNLIDLAENATPEHYEHALLAACQDNSVDGVLFIQSPKLGRDMNAMAKTIAAVRKKCHKPLLACVMGDRSIHDGYRILGEANIPTFRTPDTAVGAFGNIAAYYRNQKLLQQTPPPLTHLATPDVEGARLLIESVLAQRRYTLTEMESKALLSAFHIPVTQTILARTPNEAVMLASQIGYPVALKIDSPDILHKSDVNGVALNVMNGASVHDIFERMVDAVSKKMPEARINGVSVQRMVRLAHGRELYIGVVTDRPFGPVIAFGAGGATVELYDRRAMELPPLNQFLARQMLQNSSVAKTLGHWRGAEPIHYELLEQVLLRVSEMVCELPQLREMDINPIIVDANGAVAVDARIIVDKTTTMTRPYQHLSILPYPAKYSQTLPLADNQMYTIRAVRPDDAQMLQDLVRNLSPESRYNRFASAMTELPDNMLSRFTLIDYEREMALVAQLDDLNYEVTDQPGRIIGVSRYVTNPDSDTCEFSLMVADDFSGKGIGSRLMAGIMDVARDKGLKQIIGLVLAKNGGMLKLMSGMGFTIAPFDEDPDFKIVTYDL